MPYKDSQLAMTEFNCSNQSVNNHVKIAEARNKIGKILHEAKALYLHVDGGHIRDKLQDKRSFEAIISTVFKPESYRKISEEKEGMSKNTKITAFCDGAANCSSIVDSLAPYCREITKILDWFHILQAYDKAANVLCLNIRNNLMLLNIRCGTVKLWKL